MNSKKFFGAMTGVLAVCYFLSFLTQYIPSYVVEVKSELLLYVLEFSGRLLKFIAPCVSAAVLFISQPADNKSLLLRALPLGSASAAYNLFYYYLYFMAYGNDSIESLTLSIGASVLGVALSFGSILLGYFVCRYAARKISGSDTVSPFEGRIFELGAPAVGGIFSACFLQFSITLLAELINIVKYLIEYVGTYRGGEIVYIVVSLLFIFAELFAAHAVCFGVRKFIEKRNVFDE